MFFKQTRYLKISLFFAFTILQGCNAFQTNDKPVEVQIEIGGDVSGCLVGFDKTVSEYFNGAASNSAKVESLFDCAEGALSLFKDYTRGAKEDLWSGEELKWFLETYFLKDTKTKEERKIPGSLLSEALILKQVILGGSDRDVSRFELERTISLLRLLKKNVAVLQPLFPLNAKHLVQLPIFQFDNMLAVLEAFSGDLFEFLKPRLGSYSLSHISGLINGMIEMIKTDADKDALRNLNANLDFAFALKNLLIAGSESEIKVNEWSKLFDLGVQWFVFGLKFSAFNEHISQTGNSYLYFEGRERLHDSFLKLRELSLRTLKQLPNETITFSILEKVIDSLTEEEHFFWQTTADRAPQYGYNPISQELSDILKKNAIVPFVQNLMGGALEDDQGKKAKGITVGFLTRVWFTYQNWYQRQTKIEEIYLKVGGEKSLTDKGLSRSELMTYFGSYFTNFTAESGEIEERKIEPLKISSPVEEDIKFFVTGYRPLFNEQDTVVDFPDWLKPKTPYYSFHNMSELNLFLAFGKMLILGYAKDQDRAQKTTGITRDELNSFYWDFRRLGIHLGILDPASEEAAKSRFREANLFTTHANGNELLEPKEGIELLALLFSGGRISKDIHQKIEAVCPVGPEGTLDRRDVDAECYRKILHQNLAIYFKNMPEYVRYFSALDAKGKENYQRQLEDAGRKTGYSDQMVDPFETDVMVMIIHYIENVFQRFDTDRSGTLNVPETLVSYPVFAGAIKEISGLESQEAIEAVLTYLVKYGHKPSSAAYLWWRARRWFWSYESNRDKLLVIFSSFMKH